MKILVINPGSTSTKVSIFENEHPIHEATIRHSVKELEGFDSIFDQLDFRLKIVEDFLKQNKIELSDISAIAARGGPLPPAEGGTYIVDEEFIHITREEFVTEHPSLLAALIANKLAEKAGINAYVTDPVSVDEWHPYSRYSGHSELPRISLSHALNMRAVAKRAADELKKPYNMCNLIIVHLGGGISVSAHKKGKQIDNNNANEDGPFSPERTGTLPAGGLVKLCFSGKYDLKTMKAKITKKGGMVAYLDTNNFKEALDRAKNGDKKADEVLRAMIYQIAKEIGKMAAVLNGNVDAIVITGGIAYNNEVIDWLKERVSFIAKFIVYPGEDEMKALALATLRVLKNEETAKKFIRRNT